MCCDAPEAPKTDPMQIELARQQGEMSKEMFQYTKEKDARNDERLAKMDAQAQPLIDQYFANQQKQEGRADEAYKYNMDHRYVSERMFQDATDFDSTAGLADVRARAKADVEQAFNAQRGATTRNMQRMGVNPANGRFASAMGDMGAAQALATVQAGNAASEARRAQGVGLRQQAANVANGFAATSMNLSSAGMAAGSGALNAANGGFANGLQAQNAYNSGMGAASGVASQAGSAFGSIFNQNMQSAQYGAANSTGAALGQLAGMGIKAYTGGMMGG